MIVNNSHGFIYIHVPKTAGTAVSTVLHQFASPADIDLGGAIEFDPKRQGDRHHVVASGLDRLWKQSWNLSKHSPVRVLRNRLPQRIWDGYFKFAFVRNPFSRTWSGFHFSKRVRGMGGAFDAMSFEEFLRSEHFRKAPILSVAPQTGFLAPLGQVDYIGRFETLAEDLAQIVSIIERRPLREVGLVQRNVGARPDEWQQMSDADRAIIREVLAEDFDRLGYAPEDGAITGPVRTGD